MESDYKDAELHDLALEMLLVLQEARFKIEELFPLVTSRFYTEPNYQRLVALIEKAEAML